MKNLVICSILVSILVVGCNQSNTSKNAKETILKGSATLLVDETLEPIIEDQIDVFESRYEAKLKMVSKSELEVIKEMEKKPNSIAILTRELTTKEIQFFEGKKITPKITPFATDAIALIINRKSNDTLISVQEVLAIMKGNPNPKIKGLVFDDPNSSTVRYMNDLAGLASIPKKGVFSFGTNNEVIKFVAENEGMIGIVGMNWLSQPKPDMQNAVDAVKILSVKGLQSNQYVLPTQNNIGEGIYPLARNLYIVNCQGYSGLGMGFASFVAGDVGQRIVLKSGLLPYQVPPRTLQIRNKINKEEQ